MENSNSGNSNLNKSTSNDTEPLNRSISKLRPPRPIMRTNSSSALLTDLANFAASIGTPASDNGPKKDNTLTLEMLEPLSPKNTAHSKTTANKSSTSTTTVGMAIKAGMKRKAESNTVISDMRKNPAALTQRPVRSTQATKSTTTDYGEATSCGNFYSTYSNDRSRTKAYNNDKLWTSASLFRLRTKNTCNKHQNALVYQSDP
ncbi:hypothetical protein CPB97_005194 [Podila verticillata]|nr:hypothetical protein CPB97_005194 [Podila verticillata]